MRSSWRRYYENTVAVTLALVLHIGLAVVVFGVLEGRSGGPVVAMEAAPIPALVIDEARIEAELQRLSDEERRRERELAERETARLAAEQQRREEEQRLAELQREREQAEQAAREAEERRQEEQRRAEQAAREERAAEERRQAEEQRRAEAERQRQEEERRAEEARRQAREEQQRAEEERRRQEEQRRAEAERQRQEEQRRAEEARRRAEEEQRRAEEERRRQEEQRRAEEEARQQELARAQSELADRLRQSARQRMLADYSNRLSLLVERNWLLPAGSRSGLSSELIIQLDANGEVARVQVSRSSGDTAFDRSAVAAVQRTSPLPLPDDTELRAEIVRTGFRFVFKPEG